MILRCYPQNIHSFSAIIAYRMTKIYPHKQTIIVALICVLSVGAIATYVFYQPLGNSSQNVTIEKPTDDTSATIGTSTDWRKQFFTQSSSSKLILGTNGLSTSTSNEPLTLTDQMSRELFARFIDLKQNNLDTNDQLVQDAINRTLDNATQNAAQPKKYSPTDLLISNQNTLDEYKKYGNAVALSLSTYMPADNAPVVAANAFDKNDLSLLAQIDPMISAYKNCINSLLKIPVPQVLAVNHLNLINSVSYMVFISQGLRNTEADPMQSMVSIGIFTATQNAMRTALLDMKNYFISNSVSFLINEPGQLFSNII